MRTCVVALIGCCLAAGCYRPPLEARCSVVCGANGACPSGLACNEGGFCSPGAIACDTTPMDATEGGDAPANDASLACNRFDGQPQALLGGNSYTAYGLYSAWWNVEDGAIYATRGDVDYLVANGFTHPRMSTDGNEILMLDAMKMMHRTTWNGNEWVMPSLVATNAVLAPGTMTSTTPREMIATAGGRLYRGVETGNSWQFTEDLGTLGLSEASDPSLDPSGKRLVFVGTDNANAKAIYITTRGDVGWSAPQLLFDHSGAESSPFLTADCTQLTYSVDNVIYLLQ